MKKELTLEEWKKIGDKTKEIRDKFNELSDLLRGRLPKIKYLKQYQSANKAFDVLRSHLDDIVCGKFKDLPDNEITSIFYGMKENK
jgi:hypothetical protein